MLQNAIRYIQYAIYNMLQNYIQLLITYPTITIITILYTLLTEGIVQYGGT